MRHAGLLSALILTAALLCAMPGLLNGFWALDDNRMDERLRPAKIRSLTVWALGESLGDDTLINRLCAALEKREDGLRVFLRKAEAAELTAPEAVWPDAILYTAGEITDPERFLIPIADLSTGDVSGQSGGTVYGAALWFSPAVLSLPASWLEAERPSGATDPPAAYFGLASPTPDPQRQPLSFASLPWRRLFEPEALWIKPGVCHQQLLFVCPNTLRGELISAKLKLSPKADPSGTARAWRLREHLAALKAGESLTALPLMPVTSDQARYVSLLNTGEDGARFLRFLLSEEAGSAACENGFMPLDRRAAAPYLSDLQRQIAETPPEGWLLPNAYAYARQELEALCWDGFKAGRDPVETLLRLR